MWTDISQIQRGVGSVVVGSAFAKLGRPRFLPQTAPKTFKIAVLALCHEVATTLETLVVDADIIDLRTIKPYDLKEFWHQLIF